MSTNRLTLKQWRLSLEPASPKRCPPPPGRLDAACVTRRSRRDYRALRWVDVALEARARAYVKVGLVVELEGYGWLVSACIIRVLRGGSSVRCVVLPHCSRVLTRVSYVNCIRGIVLAAWLCAVARTRLR